MKKHRGHGSCLPCRSRSLGNLCGTSIDTDDIDFTGSRSNLVYMDKVFAFKEATSCPILSCINTGGANANNFIAEIEVKDPSNCDCSHCGCRDCNCACHVTCNCNCGPTINRNSIFNIDKAFVAVEYFNTRPPGNAPCVSIDGFDVDCVKFSNGQFIVNTDQVNAEIQRERCLDAGLPTKTFFLVSCAGPWDFRAKYILEGTVNTDGRVFCFRAEIQNAPGRPNSTLPNTALSNFAIPDLSIPCTINGIAPTVLFQFDADIELIRPKLTIKNRQQKHKGNDHSDCEETSRHSDCNCICICNCGNEDFSIVLNANLAVEPKIHVETIRKSLFCVNACEALQPCDGSELAAEMEEEEENDTDPFAPDCFCGNNGSSVSPAEDCGCSNNVSNQNRNRCSCNNNNSCSGNCSCGGNSRQDRCHNAFQFNGCTGCSW